MKLWDWRDDGTAALTVGIWAAIILGVIGAGIGFLMAGIGGAILYAIGGVIVGAVIGTLVLGDDWLVYFLLGLFFFFAWQVASVISMTWGLWKP